MADLEQFYALSYDDKVKSLIRIGSWKSLLMLKDPITYPWYNDIWLQHAPHVVVKHLTTISPINEYERKLLEVSLWRVSCPDLSGVDLDILLSHTCNGRATSASWIQMLYSADVIDDMVVLAAEKSFVSCITYLAPYVSSDDAANAAIRVYSSFTSYKDAFNEIENKLVLFKILTHVSSMSHNHIYLYWCHYMTSHLDIFVRDKCYNLIDKLYDRGIVTCDDILQHLDEDDPRIIRMCIVKLDISDICVMASVGWAKCIAAILERRSNLSQKILMAAAYCTDDDARSELFDLMRDVKPDPSDVDACIANGNMRPINNLRAHGFCQITNI